MLMPLLRLYPDISEHLPPHSQKSNNVKTLLGFIIRVIMDLFTPTSLFRVYYEIPQYFLPFNK